MSKLRSKFRTKGTEVLFGTPPPVQIKPVAFNTEWPAEPASSIAVADELPECGSSLVEEAAPGLDGSKLAETLGREAQGDELDPARAEEDLVVEKKPLPTAEIAAALAAEAQGAAEAVELTQANSIPTEEETMEAKGLAKEAVLGEPPQPEVSDLIRGVLPPRTVRGSTALGQVAIAADIQEPDELVEPLVLPERILSDDERRDLLARYGNTRLPQLDDEIDQVYGQVLEEVGENSPITTDCQNQLLQARDIVVRQDVGKVPQAEYYVEQVRARVKRSASSKSAARKYGWLITGWGLLWGTAFLGALILLSLGWFQEYLTPAQAGRATVDPTIFLPAMIWGGIGGVVAIWYSLFKHVGLRDFDTAYNLSYIGKPFFGLILGGTVYMVIHLLIMMLGIWPAGIREAQESMDAPTIAPWLIYLVAWACGFKENRIFGLVDRAMKRIFSSEQEAATAASE